MLQIQIQKVPCMAWIRRTWRELRTDWSADRESRAAIFKRSLDEVFTRAAFLTAMFAGVHAIFGFESFAYLSRFVSDLTLFSNTIPRILIAALPVLCLAIWLRRTKRRTVASLYLWFIGYTSSFQATAWIHIWPTVLAGKSEVLIYVTSANTFVFMLTFSSLALPNRLVPGFLTVLGVTFIAPLLLVAYLSKDPVLFAHVANDTFLAVTTGVIIGGIGNYLRVRILQLEMKQMSSTEKFLGKTVSRAIFEGREDLLERRTKKGFILALDIRGYTQMIQNTEAQKVGYFLNTYQAMVSDLVGQYGGFIHKTMGDGHLISFGLMDDDEVDLSDIPGIETELKQADERRAQNALKRTILVMDLIAFNTELLAAEMGIPGIRLGAGLEHGDVELRVFGDSEYRREFDIFGNTIVRATRLQAHTKALLSQVPAGSSLLLASPIAMHYATAELRSRLQETPTDGLPVRDCTDLHAIWMRTYAPAIPEGLDLFPARERNYTDDSLTEAA